ncbi:MAG: hypothetical protein ACREGF_04115, partial [Candidatus Saccharimonadales bacterium]
MANQPKPNKSAVVSTNFKPPSKQHRSFKNLSPKQCWRLGSIAGLVAIIILAAGLVLYFNHQHARAKLAFTVDGHNYSKTYVNNLITYPVSVGDTKTEAAKEAFNFLKRQAVANKLGINVPQLQVGSEQASLLQQASAGLNKTKAEPWFQLIAYDNVLQTLLSGTNSATAPQGYIFAFMFDQHAVSGPAASKPMGFGDSSLIAQDRDYANKRATYYRQQLVEHKITPEQLLSAINQDPKLNVDYSPGFNDSIHFGVDSTTPWQSQLTFNKAALSYITGQTKPGISAVKVGQLPNISYPTAQDYMDAYFYFIDLEQPGIKV